MLRTTHTRPDGQDYCITEYDEAQGWLHAQWQGFVTAQDGEQGAAAALKLLQFTHIPYLLNDNSQVRGPWFDSVEWLQRVWAPQAQRLGLRYVAHVLQTHTEADGVRQLTENPFAEQFELQLFNDLPTAEAWLRQCQQRHRFAPSARLSSAGETR